MSQPKWELIANLGDVNPIEYGGFLVFVDKTGVYAPEAEVLQEPCEGIDHWTVYRFTLEPCTFTDGVLSDNPYHPASPAWFAKSLIDIADCSGVAEAELVGQFCSDDPIERAWAWRAVGDFYGFYEFDQYPLTLNRRQVFGRYTSRLRQLERKAA